MHFSPSISMGVTLPSYALGRYFVPGSGFVRRLNGKVIGRRTRVGWYLHPDQFLKLVHSGTSEKDPFLYEIEVIFIIDL